jgi:hypothetical protein
MATWECAECTAKYAVGAPKCPQCGSTIRVNDLVAPEEEEDMAKITVHGGATNAAADEPEAGEDVSAGTSSTTPSSSEPNSDEQNEKPDPSPARTTGSRSKRNRTAADGTAPQTGTAGPKTAGSDSK